ncbi:MAG: elongation factor P maturation arginine rhamnosyltransferase EarP, partial [Neisseriaceae bacterium]|nr:elongation factor P maturation arginine rhamnosyltransferase EarP [Neisseriaceae bacterium]
MSTKNIWIFSSVIDNFGDAGVAYRIARELSFNEEFRIFFFIDNIPTLAMLENSLAQNNQKQIIQNITIIPWESTRSE